MKLLFPFADEEHEVQRVLHVLRLTARGWGDVRIGPQISLIPQRCCFPGPCMWACDPIVRLTMMISKPKVSETVQFSSLPSHI